MKTNTKNLEALALSVLLIIGIVLLSGYIPKQNVSELNSADTTLRAGKLPVYPGSQESTRYSMWSTLIGFSNKFSEAHEYVVTGTSPGNIVNWYKRQFPGFAVDNEETVNIQGKNIASLMLKKGNTTVGVVAFNQDKQTVYFVGKVINPGGQEEGTSLPHHDLAGGAEPLSRYSGSVMLSYSKDGKFPINYDIKYGTNDAYDKVNNWFKNTLKSQGWSITSQSGNTDSFQLNFKKDDDEVTINIYAPFEGTAYTSIDMSYTKRNLPDHDLIIGADPMERYPAAVMVDYNKSTMNMQGLKATEIKAEYLAPDRLDKVKQWYLDKLNAMFNGNKESGVYESDGVIDAGGKYNNKTVQIHIDFGAGKKYTDVYVDYTTTETN